MSEPLKLLLVEDDAALRDAVTLILELEGHAVTAVDGGPAALEALGKDVFNLVISDLKMEPMDGLTLLGEIRARLPQLPVMLMTAFGDVEKAVAAMQGGACDFLLKPFEPEVLHAHVRRYASVPVSDSGTVAEDPRTRELLALAGRVAETDATVMLSGESGTGKEVFARYIHNHSKRKAKPFVAINCAAIPDNLLEATLFGHEKGAFTGAHSAQAGKFEQADGGTLLLDEISEMPLSLQAKLLRVLQEREVERVGGKKPVPLDLRVLATSNRDMAAEVAAGRFREDLYYRLNVFPLAIPALRERPGDILPMARHFLARHAERIGGHATIDEGAAELMRAHPWPGNARELDNAMQRALILATGGVIRADTLRLCLGSGASRAPAISAAEPASLAAPVVAASSGGTANMKDLEREHILGTLKAVGGSRKKAVEKLGISERTLRYKLQQYREEGYPID
ncbi:sigma-54-dependent transcriptional regulator [Denitromonas iodatirespirans]|uniref:Sigma-54-dependent Fis family transcriptional regulator n=1 Tax=Denitromonas iodatirespirans TaxID=2795389 RepID=A0A944DFB6_DENI1|nr:sigma-54 dependent transcriptional regulator [Denitromonas iodatirespirans]MBT0963343.1 sigma-54-dependent Fis family transcriptional regulator [Denitromonas iodatirespirans]